MIYTQFPSIQESIPLQKGLTCFVGGGGKTTSMYQYAAILSEKNRVIVTTTTHIFEPADVPVVYGPNYSEIERVLEKSNIVCVGMKDINNKLKTANLDYQKLLSVCDYILVEADGAKNRPIKAPGPNEPVIPNECSHVIAVVGMDSLNRRISEISFRPELLAELTGKETSDFIDRNDIKTVIESERGYRKHIRNASFSVILNKTDSDSMFKEAQSICELLDWTIINNLCISSFWKGMFYHVGIN